MSEHSARVVWERGEASFLDNRYSRGHRWEFDGGLSVPASSSPHVVPVPQSVEANLDPEEAFVASLSSCHMLFFLSLAAQYGFLVDSYDDRATGEMGKDAAGRMAMLRVVLRPAIVFGGERKPTASQLHALHRQSHECCFIANSVKTTVVVQSA